jgi:hypothetical protein
MSFSVSYQVDQSKLLEFSIEGYPEYLSNFIELGLRADSEVLEQEVYACYKYFGRTEEYWYPFDSEGRIKKMVQGMHSGLSRLEALLFSFGRLSEIKDAKYLFLDDLLAILTDPTSENISAYIMDSDISAYEERNSRDRRWRKETIDEIPTATGSKKEFLQEAVKSGCF